MWEYLGMAEISDDDDFFTIIDRLENQRWGMFCILFFHDTDEPFQEFLGRNLTVLNDMSGKYVLIITVRKSDKERKIQRITNIKQISTECRLLYDFADTYNIPYTHFPCLVFFPVFNTEEFILYKFKKEENLKQGYFNQFVKIIDILKDSYRQTEQEIFPHIIRKENFNVLKKKMRKLKVYSGLKTIGKWIDENALDIIKLKK